VPQSTLLDSHQMESMWFQAHMIEQSAFGAPHQVKWLQVLSKVMQTGSILLDFHQMVSMLSQAQMIGDFASRTPNQEK
jgi:hypothetical protein